MAIRIVSKYDKLGFWGWFIYIPILFTSFRLGSLEKNRSILFLFIFLPVLSAIVRRIKTIQETRGIIKNKKKDLSSKGLIGLDKMQAEDLIYEKIWLCVFILFFIWLLYFASKDYSSWNEFLYVIENIFGIN